MEPVSIGTVRRKGGRAWVEIEPGFREGLEGLEEFSPYLGPRCKHQR